MRKIWWTDFAAREFDGLDPNKTIAILPIAAVEQHGPHLPVGTDTIINTSMIELLIERAPADMDLRILPVQAIGKSNEHIWAKGTITHTATNLIDAWTQIGLEVARAGVKKIIFINSHGGNEEIMGIVARELRVRAGMLAVKSGWRFTPPGVLSDLQASPRNPWRRC
ncbi:creatininase family protein [Devosia riboflavina]